MSNNLDLQIAQTERELENLKRQKAAEENITATDQSLAEWLHKRLCHHNHIDGCGWYYSTWTDPVMSSERARYLERACLIRNFFREKKINTALATEILKELL